MDVQDQTNHTNPSGGHDSHAVHLCHRCGWPFPNPHPSAKHRRAHKKICGTIEGYTTLIDSEAVSDDEHHLDDDKEKTPSPKIEKKNSVGDIVGTEGRFSRSEEDFADAVAEFSDSGVVDRSASSKTMDRDLFFSFKDAENDGTNEVLDSSTEVSKVDAKVMDSENVEKIEEEITTECDPLEAKLNSADHDGKSLSGLVKDGVFESQEAESIDIVKAGEEKVQETLVSETKELEIDVSPETVTEEAKSLEVQDSDTSKSTSEILEFVGGYNRVEQEKMEKLESASKDEIIEDSKQEKFESDCENVSEVQESEIVHGVEGISEEIKQEKTELDHEHVPEVTKESETDDQKKVEVVSEEIKDEKSELDHEHVLEVAKESETDDQKKVEGVGEAIKREKFESDQEHASEVVKAPEADQSVSILTEKEDLSAPESENSSLEQAQEVFNTLLTEPVELSVAEPEKSDSVLTEKGNLGAPKSENCSSEQIPEVTSELKSSEKDDLDAPKSEEQTSDGVPEPDAILIEKEDRDAPISEKSSNEHNHEVVQKPDTVLVKKEDLGVPNLENLTKEHTPEIVEEPSSILPEKKEIDASNSEKYSIEQTQKVKENTSDHSIAEIKNDSDVVSEPIADEGTGKPKTNLNSVTDISVDSSCHNSLEGNWGSGSVLSTASIDPETVQSTDKLKVNSVNPVTTLVEPDGKDPKPTSVEGPPELPPKAEAPQPVGLPPLTDSGNESDRKKRNEEVVIEKVTITNRSSNEKHSTPLKSLLGDAKLPESMVEKDEGVAGQEEVSSPPKLIEDGKKGKKGKGRGSWLPFVCCSSVNVN